ncbi:transporter substrate-binding domain-containing protein [Colwellia echini]|uniref:Amino acid ABC transporter substrate-binding protein n=1 Tax=Colwellia echini TaxID=1982103 RepID=A0ABY3MYJ3_9GAMM|nr:transporter substrate-binding domain-containing protein [Colwellia echini]TYK66278.1 amino acid ABC transporter substrate-binding protein [Colwellia echini]
MLKFLICISLISTLTLSGYVQALDVVYAGKNENIYINRLLRHVLAYSKNKNYTPKAYGEKLPRGREYKFLAQEGVIDVLADGATLERESKYLPIRFPILKGLNSWRISLINKENKDIFLKVFTNEDLKEFTAAQFHSWSDSEILLSNGIKVYKGGNQEGLYRMLHKKRIDYYPRSLLEINREAKNHQHLNIMIEPYIIIHYPSAFYFYVNKENFTLAADIKEGLEKALKDGSFDRLFIEYFGDHVNEVINSNRRVFTLDNPLLSDKTPLQRKELWINFDQSINK